MRRKSRRPAREAALRALYENDLVQTPVSGALLAMEAYEELSEELREYAKRLAYGVAEKTKSIDAILKAHLHDYDLKRVAAVDRNLLRLAVYELYHCDDVPPKVTLDEAIELAKKYSTAESGRFVNGVLAAVLEKSPKKDWTPPESAPVEEPAPPEPEPALVELNEDAPEVQEAARVGKWKLRSEEPQP